MVIKVLDDALISKIAAGEVIERPSSVVKELIENSIDADSTAIKVEVVNGGKGLIKITDNGRGMNKEDAKLSVKRHATSKIMDENDLFDISTLGFRGEALASIAAVSKMKLVTRQEDSVEGCKILLSGGEIIKDETIGSSVGTSIEVAELFFNTPARQKYLKANTAESVSYTHLRAHET